MMFIRNEHRDCLVGVTYYNELFFLLVLILSSDSYIVSNVTIGVKYHLVSEKHDYLQLELLENPCFSHGQLPYIYILYIYKYYVA